MAISSKSKMILVVVIVFLIVGGVVGIVEYESALRTNSVPPPNANDPQLDSRPLLSTVPLPTATRDHLLDGGFNTVNLFEKISLNCMSAFESSFVSSSGAARNSKIELANPGKIFQSSDALIEGAPFRRLEFAGMGTSSCFIYYQHGGTMYPRFCLAIMNNDNQKMLWVGETRKQAHNLDQLRHMLLKGDFIDTSGSVC